MIQRLGRCHRNGEPEWDGEAHWLDVDAEKAAPYQRDDLGAARRYLTALEGEDVSPRALADFRYCGQPVELTFEHVHVVRHRDLLDLFDTAPDLSGNDMDVSRFVRGDEPETDVQVFWRAGSPSNDWDADERRRQAARREELCSIPIGSFKKEFLEAGRTAYRFDHLDGEWRPVAKKDAGTVVPGQTFWVPADQGGYARETGWTRGAGPLPEGLLLPLPDEPPKSRRRRPEGADDSDEWSACGWRTVAEHTDEVVQELTSLLGPPTNSRCPSRSGKRSWSPPAGMTGGKCTPCSRAASRPRSTTPRIGSRCRRGSGGRSRGPVRSLSARRWRRLRTSSGSGTRGPRARTRRQTPRCIAGRSAGSATRRRPSSASSRCEPRGASRPTGMP